LAIPLQILTDNQRFWYARQVVGAILADGEIASSEIEFVKQVMADLKKPEYKKELLQILSTKQSVPPLAPPPGIAKTVLAAIYLELILIVISDLDFAEPEQEFLEKTADLIGFSGAYKRKLMLWQAQGLAWKQHQLSFFPPESGVALGELPVAALNDAQRYWCASVLLSAILLDWNLDAFEVAFLKSALGIISNKKDQAKLMAYVKNKLQPKLTEPPGGMAQDHFVAIFFNVMLILSADETLAIQEQTFLKQLSQFCEFSDQLFNDLIGWCRMGIEWKGRKQGLIARVEMVSERGAGTTKEEDEAQMTDRYLRCLVCGCGEVHHFHLKLKNRKPMANIFGADAYPKIEGEPAPLDYNRFKPMVCPKCLFVSISKKHFQASGVKGEFDGFSPEFINDWKSNSDKRREIFGRMIEQIGHEKPKDEYLDLTYRTAIAALEQARPKVGQDAWDWELVQARLSFAELLMSAGRGEQADIEMQAAITLAQNLFSNSRQNTLILHSAKLLLTWGLYLENSEQINTFYNFILEMAAKPSELEEGAKKLVTRLAPQAKKAFEDRNDYKKKNLVGYHLPITVAAKKKDSAKAEASP